MRLPTFKGVKTEHLIQAAQPPRNARNFVKDICAASEEAVRWDLRADRKEKK